MFVGSAAASLLAAGAQSASTGARAKAKQPQATGVSIHHCSCNVGCPCMFGPQLPGCRMVMIHHVDRGTARGKKLDGATVVTIYPSLEDLKTKPRFEGAVYVDSALPRDTQELLVRIFTPQRLRSGKKLLAQPANIRFTRTASGFRTEVKGFLTAETTARLGRDGKQIRVQNVNFAEGTEWRVGENLALAYHDPFANWKWDMKGKNGTWTEWAWTGGNTPAPAVDPANPPRGARAVSDGTRVACSCCGRP